MRKTQVLRRIIAVSYTHLDVYKRQPMVTIGNPSSAQIIAMVGENDIKKLSEGMACSIRMQGSDTVCTGKIVSIGAQMSAASLESGSKKAKVCIKPDEPIVGCMAGGSASVSIEVQRISDAVSVPIDAVDSEENVYVVNKQGILEKMCIRDRVCSVHPHGVQYEPQLFSPYSRSTRDAEAIYRRVLRAAQLLGASKYICLLYTSRCV